MSKCQSILELIKHEYINISNLRKIFKMTHLSGKKAKFVNTDHAPPQPQMPEGWLNLKPG